MLYTNDVELRVYARLRSYNMSIAAMRRMAKNVGMRNYSKLRKDELLGRLTHHLLQQVHVQIKPDMPYSEVTRIMREFDEYMYTKFYE